MDQKRTEIATVGEFGLIDRIRRIVDFPVDDATLRDDLLVGISDDTAVYQPTPGKVQLLTTDAFVEGIHFDLTFTSFKHLGWKAMAANLSDIAAMGGVPRYATITLALPKKISLEMVEEFYAGATHACKTYSCLIVGGDTVASTGNTMIAVTLTGEAPNGHVKYRTGARVGEYLCVTGHLGGSIGGLKILQREKKRFAESQDTKDFQPDLDPYTPALEKHLMPKPRLDLSKILADRVAIGGMIDVSDGVASEVHHLCRESNVGAEIFEHNLPIEAITQRIASEFNESPTDYALYGGEEFELLFTISDAEFEKLDKLTNDVTIIGRVTDKEKSIVYVRENGEREPLRFGGWNHFRG
jgi:thiamine-monophosphate kinase